MLTFKELFQKNFTTTLTRNRIKLEKSWNKLEEEIIENITLN